MVRVKQGQTAVRSRQMKNLRNINWKAAAVAVLVTVLAWWAWSYLQTKTNQAHLQRTLERKETELTNRLQELDQHKTNNKELEQIKQNLEKEKAELHKQLQAKAASRKVYAASAPRRASVAVSGNCEAWMAAAGISELSAARELIRRESGCNPNAVNRSSGACGVAQELPCGKSGCSLGDGACQVAWMNRYVKNRYGSWANAVAHHDRANWY